MGCVPNGEGVDPWQSSTYLPKKCIRAPRAEKQAAASIRGKTQPIGSIPPQGSHATKTDARTSVWRPGSEARRGGVLAEEGRGCRVLKWPVFNETDQHRNLRDAIRASMGGWRRFVVTIDGVSGAGKSNLALYLGWQLDMPVVHTDMFFDLTQPGIRHRTDEMQRVVNSRLSLDRPVIIDGVMVLDSLERIQVVPDYSVWVRRTGHDGPADTKLGVATTDYQTRHSPSEKSDTIFEWSEDVDTFSTGSA